MSNERYFKYDDESPVAGRKVDVTEYVAGLEAERDRLREDAVVLVAAYYGEIEPGEAATAAARMRGELGPQADRRDDG